MTAETARPKSDALESFREDRQETVRPEVLADLTEAERERVFEEELDRLRPLRAAVRRAVQTSHAVRTAKSFQRYFKGRGRRGGKAKKRSCPTIFAKVSELLRQQPEATARELWDELAHPDGFEIYLAEHPGSPRSFRLQEDGGKSLSNRSFEKYVTQARKALRSK